MADPGNTMSGISLGLDVVESGFHLLRCIRIARDSDTEIRHSNLQLRFLELRYSRCAKVYQAFARGANVEGNQLILESFQNHRQIMSKAWTTVENLSNGEPAELTTIDQMVDNLVHERGHRRRDSVVHSGEDPSVRRPITRSRSFIDKIQWALFTREESRELIIALTRNIEQLESVLPKEQTHRICDQMRLQEVQLLSQVPASEKGAMVEALEAKPNVHPELASDLKRSGGPLADISGNEWIGNVSIGQSRQRNGEILCANAVLSSKNNRWQKNTVSGTGRQHNGNTILTGRDSFWDD